MAVVILTPIFRADLILSLVIYQIGITLVMYWLTCSYPTWSLLQAPLTPMFAWFDSAATVKLCNQLRLGTHLQSFNFRYFKSNFLKNSVRNENETTIIFSSIVMPITLIFFSKRQCLSKISVLLYSKMWKRMWWN